VQRDIALKVLMYVPDYVGTTDLSAATSVELFNQWLHEEQHNCFQIAGKALLGRTLIDFLPMKHKGTNEGWAEISEAASDVLAALEDQQIKDVIDEELKSKINEMTRRTLDSAPFEQRQWSKVARTWWELCEGPLSDDSIEKWANEQGLKSWIKEE
jgi:hypothetical protein